MRLNIFKRSMIFATFFGSCLCIALLVASLATKHWIDARAKRTSNPLESEGRIHFGLFEGHKALNLGYGWRKNEFDVRTPSAHYPARRWAWMGSAGLCVAAAGAAVAAAAAAAHGAARPRGLTALYLSNGFAMLCTLGAIAVWLTEFYLRLQHNVMSKDNLANMWTSDGMADLGFSFWLVVGAAVTAFVNILCVAVATADSSDADTSQPVMEEKVNGAIMLY